MGNKHSCCVAVRPRHGRKYRDEPYSPRLPADTSDVVLEDRSSLKQQSSTSNLQHISEREPDDDETDPSVHPTARTIFLTRSKSEIQKNHRRRSQYDSHSRAKHPHHPRSQGHITKYSSCSTIYIDDSTVSQPNLKNTIKAVALAIYFHIRNRPRNLDEAALVDQQVLDVFDEKLHPLTLIGFDVDGNENTQREPLPPDYDTRDPEHKTIYRFVRTLFNAAQLTAECAIVTLVYLERLLTYAELYITPGNWKRAVLGAILLSSKVWDDQAVWNVDYCQILKDITVEDMNELERQFLELLQFNINVPSSVYAKYYFDLRALADAHDLAFPFEPLSKERAVKLEAMSNTYEDKIRTIRHALKRSHSLDGITRSPQASKAIIS